MMRQIVLIAGLITGFAAAAAAQDSRYVEYGYSFQPPAGWQQDVEAEGNIRVQYFGPERADGTQPKLNLSVQNYAVGLSEQQAGSLSAEMIESIRALGMKDPKVISSSKTTISGHEALQIDYSYTQDGEPTRLRQVYVPVSDHKRTYLFTFVDKAQHFDQSAPAVQGAVNTFTVARAGDSPATRSSESAQEPGVWKWVLTIIGVLALVVVAVATYLLIRRRAIA
jgi:cobalamin biosynthesis Mg chelatase CobN